MSNIGQKIVQAVMPKSLQRRIIEDALNTIFVNVANDLKYPVQDIFIGIEYRESKAFYYPYVKQDGVMKKMKEEDGSFKELDLEYYINKSDSTVINMVGGSEQVGMTIGQWGLKFAAQCEADIEDIDLILKYNQEEEMPYAILQKRVDGVMQKVGMIDFGSMIS